MFLLLNWTGGLHHLQFKNKKIQLLFFEENEENKKIRRKT